MASQPQTAKYIERLVRIITQKEKIIDQLRKAAKPAPSQHSPDPDRTSSMTGRKVREEITLNNLQIKLLHQKMSAMEVRIQQFSQGLNEETLQNQQLKLQIQTYERREKGLLAQIASLTHLNHNLEQKVAELECQYAEFAAKNGTLQSIIAELNERMHQLQTFQSKEQKEKRDGLCLEMQNKVENIYKIVNYHPLNENNFINDICKSQTRQEDQNLRMLAKIEEFLRKQHDLGQSDVLNDTLDGLSVIMRSFQDKKEDLHFFAQSKRRKNCSASEILALKEPGQLTYPKKHVEVCCLQKSKVQTTRLNDTSKLFEGLLGQ